MEFGNSETRAGERDDFPEVSLAYKSLDLEIQRSRQSVIDKVSPEIPVLEKSLAEAFDTVFDGKKYINLGTPKQINFGTHTIKIGDSSFKRQIKTIPHTSTLYWGDLEEHGIEIFRRAPMPHSEYSPSEDNFIGFEKLRQYSHETLGLNLAPPKTLLIYDDWIHDAFYPVCYRYDLLVKDIFGQNLKNGEARDLLEKYYVEREKIEKLSIEQMEKTAPGLKNRISQLADSIKSIPVGFLRPSLLPKYIESGIGDLRIEKNIDIFYLPYKDRLVRAPLNVGIDGNIFKAKPNLLKTMDAEKRDWYIMAAEIRDSLIVPLKSRTQWRPE